MYRCYILSQSKTNATKKKKIKEIEKKENRKKVTFCRASRC